MSADIHVLHMLLDQLRQNVAVEAACKQLIADAGGYVDPPVLATLRRLAERNNKIAELRAAMKGEALSAPQGNA